MPPSRFESSAVERKVTLVSFQTIPAAGSSKFRYTPDVKNSKLTTALREQYEREGFIVVKGLIPAEDLERYRA